MGISTPSNRRGMRRGIIPSDSMETLQRRLAADDDEEDQVGPPPVAERHTRERTTCVDADADDGGDRLPHGVIGRVHGTAPSRRPDSCGFGRELRQEEEAPEEQPSTAGRPEGGRRVQWAPKLEQVRVTLSHIPAIDGLRVLAVGWVVAGNSLYGMGTSIGPVRAPTHPPSARRTSQGSRRRWRSPSARGHATRTPRTRVELRPMTRALRTGLARAASTLAVASGTGGRWTERARV